jgi:carbonic anhydrase/acetyltransferase-like protein (isoleucine patch superfamily)
MRQGCAQSPGVIVIYTVGARRIETADEDYYVAPGAQVIGSVRLGRGTSIWFNSVVRGDGGWIVLEDGTNIQDGAILHSDDGAEVNIGRHVTVGHGALLHGCSVGEGSLIGNRAIVLDGVQIGKHCLVAAGALVPPRKVIPDGSVVMGAPAEVVRSIQDKDLAMMAKTIEHYRTRARWYRSSLALDPSSVRELRTDGHL